MKRSILYYRNREQIFILNSQLKFDHNSDRWVADHLIWLMGQVGCRSFNSIDEA